MENLESLKITGKFSEIPKSISNLKKLKLLILDGKGITTIPKELYAIQTLKELDLQRNDLKYLPEGIFGLLNLQNLKLSHNFLTALPRDIYTTNQWGKVIDGKAYDIDIRDNRICNVTAEQDEWLQKFVSKNWRMDQDCE